MLLRLCYHYINYLLVLCGKESCYKTEDCVKDEDDYECKCNQNKEIYCHTMIDEFCGSDMKTHQSKCASRIADCFSDTIKSLHKGECKKGTSALV